MNQKRDEDSGLHEIRDLASSTKARLSSRRSTQSPVVNEDDVLASSSAGWKAVALPEPAKMVSLPELASLPTKAQVVTEDKAARKALAAEAKQEAKLEAKLAKTAAPVAAVESAAPGVAVIGSRIAAKQSSGKGKWIAFIGVGLAAAAGAAVYMTTQKTSDTSTLSYESKAPAALPEMTAKKLPAPPAVAAEPVEEKAAVEEAPVVVAAVEPPPEPAKPDRGAKDKVHKVEIRDTMPRAKEPEKAPPPAPKEAPAKGSGGEEEPSFDALLKEAGVTDQKKEAKPKLDKKSLSGGDIKTGMQSVSSKAQACYAGTQGMASVKLTVAPTGKVQKVTVTGPFAGTPVAACVEKAVKSATFPPWDGGPQSFGYSYLLAE